MQNANDAEKFLQRRDTQRHTPIANEFIFTYLFILVVFFQNTEEIASGLVFWSVYMRSDIVQQGMTDVLLSGDGESLFFTLLVCFF